MGNSAAAGASSGPDEFHIRPLAGVKPEARPSQPVNDERVPRFRFPRAGQERGMRYATVSAVPQAGFSLLWVIYLVIGGIVSATHHYWSNLHALKPIVSAILALLLWPLLLVGINLHVH